jgi:uncharacterized membrane protein YjgN (DUF898 family)
MKNYKKKKSNFIKFFIRQAVLQLLGFCCVTHLYIIAVLSNKLQMTL